MSPLSRLHHHDITTIVELFSCNLERCSHTENMDLALGQVSLLTKTFWRRDFPWVLQFSVYSRVATPIQVETIVMHYKIWTSSWNHGGGQYEAKACSILTWHDLKHYSSTHRSEEPLQMNPYLRLPAPQPYKEYHVFLTLHNDLHYWNMILHYNTNCFNANITVMWSHSWIWLVGIMWALKVIPTKSGCGKLPHY